MEQFEHRDSPRYELDSFLLRVMGFTDSEIDQLLPKVYQAIAQELRTLKETMRGQHIEEKDEETEE